MGKLSRDKGKVGEREVAALLREYGFEGKRGVQYQGGKDSADVTGLPGFHIEVKRTEKFALYPAMAQAERDRALESKPVVFHRKSKNDWVVVLYAKDFLDIVLDRGALGAALLRSAKEEEGEDKF